MGYDWWLGTVGMYFNLLDLPVRESADVRNKNPDDRILEKDQLRKKKCD